MAWNVCVPDEETPRAIRLGEGLVLCFLWSNLRSRFLARSKRQHPDLLRSLHPSVIRVEKSILSYGGMKAKTETSLEVGDRRYLCHQCIQYCGSCKTSAFVFRPIYGFHI